MPAPKVDSISLDYDSFISKQAKRRVQSQLKALKPYYKPGVISFGGGLPHPSTWPINSMTISVPFANKSVFVPGYDCATPDKALPLGEYVAPPAPPPSVFGTAVPGHLTPDFSDLLQYGMGHGSPSFMAWLTEHTQRTHNPPYANWDVISTAGNTDGVEAVINVLADDGDNVLVEEFAYPGLLTSLSAHNIQATGVPMDGDGVTPAGLDTVMSNWDESSKGSKPRLIFMVPTCSNPTGITMSAERKREVYHVARKHGLLIVEDDPYCFLQVRPNGANSPIVPTFLSLDIDGRVIRVDTFSKIIAPGSRCGWITAHKDIILRVLRRNEATTHCPSGFSVAAISGVLQAWGGHEGFEQHYLPHISSIYVKRCLAMLDAFEKHLPKAAAEWVNDAKGGMFIFLRLRVETHPQYDTLDPEDISQQTFDAMIEEKVITAPSHYFKAPGGVELSKDEEAKRIFLRLSFSYGSEEDIEEGVKRMSRALAKVWQL